MQTLKSRNLVNPTTYSWTRHELLLGGVLTFDGLHVHVYHLCVLVHHLPGLHEDLALLPQQVRLRPEQREQIVTMMYID